MSRSRVALDARRLQDKPLGGVGRALAGVIDLLATEIDLVLLTDGRRPPVETGIAQQAMRPPTRSPETVWLQWCVSRWLRGFDGVFHGTFNQLPFRLPVPAVITIYDLSFEVHPEDFGPAKRRAFQVQARHGARVAGRVTTPTMFTKDELVQCYGLEPARVLVTSLGVEARFSPSRVDGAVRLCSSLGVTGRYVVAMGGAPRRGLEVGIAAWRRIRDEGTDTALVVLGSERPPPEPGLAHAGAIDDEAWAALLAGADVFCYPTRYEGFGFPALESIASGTPVVCAPVGSLPEVLGDAAEWCEQPTVDAIAAGLRRVLDNPDHAAELGRRGLERAAAHPSWEHTASVLLRAYREASGD